MVCSMPPAAVSSTYCSHSTSYKTQGQTELDFLLSNLHPVVETFRGILEGTASRARLG